MLPISPTYFIGIRQLSDLMVLLCCFAGIFGARIEVQGINHTVESVKEGKYWRLLAPGNTYKIRAVHDDYKVPEHFIQVQLVDRVKAATVIDFQLSPLSIDYTDVLDAPAAVGGENPPESRTEAETMSHWTLRPDGFLMKPEFKYHHFKELQRFINFYAYNYPNITRQYSVGKSVDGRELWVLEISDNPGVRPVRVFCMNILIL